MSQSLIIAANLIAVTILVFRLYYPRYRRKDMVVAILQSQYWSDGGRYRLGLG